MRKPPYTLAAILSGRAKTPEELRLVHAIDVLMKKLWVNEHITPMKNRNEFLQKHIEAAYEYYETFSEEEMAELLAVEAMTQQMARAREEADINEVP